ncbi:hypothetical protein K503DRAFT_857760 [Rhizopogon vinicolor AM-OR11-026]|uniref:Uncharacterized protein n=1 Tax=Rhizopogon vinicolor AM-OR11-026 TaxID=1314800 RepID=A0A1B7MW15_9AGAM|nr:hypothetical protein K503DRAFT_857760 [Rhizopogon vinicolor AM-OR11-026]
MKLTLSPIRLTKNLAFVFQLTASMRWELPVTQRGTITCHDDFRHAKTHGVEQRYVSPTTGICRKLVVQAVKPNGPSEVLIKSHTNHAIKLALWLLETPLQGWDILWWLTKWLFFTLMLFWSVLWSVSWIIAQFFFQIDLSDDSEDDTEVYNTGYYKPYLRKFQGQLWAARSSKEYSSRVVLEGEKIPTHTLYPRVLIILDREKNVWEHCEDRETIIRTRFIAISYRTVDAFERGSNENRDKALFIEETACWYANDDVYDANLWDILPEIQVAGVTENGALVLDGCRAAAIRWKDFPEIAFGTTESLKRSIVEFVACLSWPTLIAGIVIFTIRISRAGGIVLIVIGILLLLSSTRLYVYSRSGRVSSVDPWLIGVKGVITKKDVEKHLYGGARGRHFPRMFFTPSGSQFSIAKHGTNREGCETQYDKATFEESGLGAGKMYTLIDTVSSTMYYFRAERAPTVCIFTGREGGLGRCPPHAHARREHSRHLSIGGLEYKPYYINAAPVLLLSSFCSTTTNIISKDGDGGLARHLHSCTMFKGNPVRQPCLVLERNKTGEHVVYTYTATFSKSETLLEKMKARWWHPVIPTGESAGYVPIPRPEENKGKKVHRRCCWEDFGRNEIRQEYPKSRLMPLSRLRLLTPSPGHRRISPGGCLGWVEPRWIFGRSPKAPGPDSGPDLCEKEPSIYIAGIGIRVAGIGIHVVGICIAGISIHVAGICVAGIGIRVAGNCGMWHRRGSSAPARRETRQELAAASFLHE